MTTLDDVQAGGMGEGKAADRFKVGDRVRLILDYIDLKRGHQGTVICLDGDGQPPIMFDGEVIAAHPGDARVELVVPPAPAPPTPTVRVRIAVAVDAEGGWYAAGSATLSDAAALEFAGESMDRPSLHWLTADLPLPSVPEVVGTVEEGP